MPENSVAFSVPKNRVTMYYKAFGTNGDECKPITKSITYGSEVPEAETHDGIILIEVRSYGDDPTDFLLTVYATTQARAVEQYEQTWKALKALIGAFWTGET